VELETGRKLKTFRSDNGGEFTSTEFESYLKRAGVKHQLTISKCPEQNGIAERMNRTLIEMVCSMLASAGLPKSFGLNLSPHQFIFEIDVPLWQYPTRSLLKH
jgi:transposase InsO family protein